MRPMRMLLAVSVTLTACTTATVAPTPTTTTPAPTIKPAPTTTTSIPTTTTLPSIQVSGRVVSATGEPISRATVTMGEITTVTAPDGWFSLETTSPVAMTVTKRGWVPTDVPLDETTSFYEAALGPERLRGLRVSAEAAGDDAMFGSLIELAGDTAVNAFVFDSKREGGDVLYDTAVDEAHAIGAVESVYDPAARIEQAKTADLYTITRIVVFEDARRVAAFPEEKLAGPWLDPTSPTARAYNLALAEEACALGFDEIMFDYVRYPAGRTAEVSGQLDLTEEDRVGAVSEFLGEARSLLNPMGCAVSAAIFAIVVSSPDDQGLGQRPEEVSAQVDVLSPMVYPSHYSNGWLGFADPNDYPYEVTADAISDALERMDPGTRLRPWLQAFWWNNSQIRRSIAAAEDLGSEWILWNVRSNYDLEALPTDQEVS